jgi:hypothetical protein
VSVTEGGEKFAEPTRSGKGRRMSSLLGLPAIAVGIYTQLDLLIPLGAAALIGFLLWKTRFLKDSLLIQAVSVQGGHAVWMLVGMLLVTFGTALRIEVLAYALAVLVLAFHPRKWTAVILLVYQFTGLLINVINLWAAPIGGAVSRALVAHVSFRVAAIVLLILLLRRGLPLAPKGDIAAVFE